MSEKKGATGQSFIRKEITSYRIGALIRPCRQKEITKMNKKCNTLIRSFRVLNWNHLSFDQFLLGSKIDKRYSGHVLKVKNLGISMVFLCSVALFGLICGKLQLPGSSITFFWLNQARQPKHIGVK